MRYKTTDPITGNDVTSLESAPYVIEGSGEDALKIYFESERSRTAYLVQILKNSVVTVLRCLIPRRVKAGKCNCVSC